MGYASVEEYLRERDQKDREERERVERCEGSIASRENVSAKYRGPEPLANDPLWCRPRAAAPPIPRWPRSFGTRPLLGCWPFCWNNDPGYPGPPVELMERSVPEERLHAAPPKICPACGLTNPGTAFRSGTVRHALGARPESRAVPELRLPVPKLITFLALAAFLIWSLYSSPWTGDKAYDLGQTLGSLIATVLLGGTARFFLKKRGWW